MTQIAITQRVKFLIKYIIGQGFAENQEDLGKKIGIPNRSYFSQLIKGERNNKKMVSDLLKLVSNINPDWLYDENIENPFLENIEEIKQPKETNLERVIKELENNIQLLKKDVKYYADMADSRLQTINVQNKLIDNYEKQLIK